MEKYFNNLTTAMSDASPMLALSMALTFVCVGLASVFLLVFLGAWIISYTGAGIFITIPALAIIRVGYAVWTGK